MHTLKRLLNLILKDDHKKGCEGRNYVCSCGYEAKVLDVAEEARDRQLIDLMDEAHTVLSELYADYGKVKSLKWMDRAGGVIDKLKRELGK